MKNYIFLSYANNDKRIAEELCSFLENNQVQCWIAPRDIHSGVNYAVTIIDAIDECQAMVLIFSGSANQSPHILREVERAVNQNKRIIVVRIEEVLPTRNLEYYLSSTHWLDCLPISTQDHFSLVLNTLRELLYWDKQKIFISVHNDDVLTYPGDIAIIQYFGQPYGLEQQVIDKIRNFDENISNRLENMTDFLLTESRGFLGVQYVLFTKITSPEYGSPAIREIIRNSIEYLAHQNIIIEDLILPLQGIYYSALKEHEFMNAELEGILDVISAWQIPKQLNNIKIVTNNRRTYNRINIHCTKIFPKGYIDRNKISEIRGLLDKTPLIFISTKSADYHYGYQLYEFLKKKGKNVFFSQESLPDRGNADFRKEIDKALDSAKHMIVVGSSIKNITAPWVESEWGFFINEKRAGRKSGNLITMVVGTIDIAKLPPSLRGNEVIPFEEIIFDRLMGYLN